jgi:hypothetical protein
MTPPVNSSERGIKMQSSITSEKLAGLAIQTNEQMTPEEKAELRRQVELNLRTTL